MPEKILKNIKKHLWWAITAIVFITGICLRFDAYLINNSFFTDEVLLAFNVFEKDYIPLFLPLKYFQSAPFLFLISSKFLSQIAGYNELSMRFIPFISSLLSIYFFYKLTCFFYKNKWLKTLALFTFCINYQLLFYTQTFKQYSSDVLFAVMFLYFGLKFYDKITSKKHFIILGIIMLISTYYSFPMFIITASYITSMLFDKKKPLKNIIFACIFPAAGLLIYFLFNICLKTDTGYFLNYWHKGFEVFGLEIYKINFEFLFRYYSYPLIFLAVFIAGFYHLYQKNRFLFFNVACIIFYTLLAAFLKLYPFERRLALFIIPVLILIIILPLDNLKKKFASFATAILVSIFLLSGYFNFIKEYAQGKISYLRQDIKPLLSKLKEDKDNKIYLYYGSLSSYYYYSLILDIPKNNVIAGTYPNNENISEKYMLQDIKNLPKGLYYLLFIQGTNTYKKDLKAFNDWVKDNNINILEDISLQQTRLVKIFIN